MTPDDLCVILHRTTAADLPSGVLMVDVSDTWMARRQFYIGAALVATVSMQLNKGDKCWCPIAFEKQEPEIHEMLHRIALVTRARIAGDIDAAKIWLERFNAATAGGRSPANIDTTTPAPPSK